MKSSFNYNPSLYNMELCIKGETISLSLGIDLFWIYIEYRPQELILSILLAKPKFLFNIIIKSFTSFKLKALQAIYTPLFAQHPSSDIQIARAKGVKYSLKLGWILFFPFL